MHPPELPRVLSAQSKVLSSISPEMAEDLMREFRAGKTLRELARLFLSGHQVGVATNAIGKLLKDTIPGPEYKELITGRSYNRQLLEGIGIHGQSTAEKQEAGRLSAIKSGAHPYDEQELSRLLELIEDKDYRLGTRIHADKIARVLNGEFYGGSDVRNSANVRKQVSRIRKNIKAS